MHFGAKESLDARPAAPVEAVVTESESGAGVNGRGSKQLGGGVPVVAWRGRTQLGAPSECMIIVHIIVILI